MKTVRKNKPTFLALAALTVLGASSLQSINAMNPSTKSTTMHTIDKASIKKQIKAGTLSFKEFLALYPEAKKSSTALKYATFMGPDGFMNSSYQTISDLVSYCPSMRNSFSDLYIDANNFHLVSPAIVQMLIICDINYKVFIEKCHKNNDYSSLDPESPFSHVELMSPASIQQKMKISPLFQLFASYITPDNFADINPSLIAMFVRTDNNLAERFASYISEKQIKSPDHQKLIQQLGDTDSKAQKKILETVLKGIFPKQLKSKL